MSGNIKKCFFFKYTFLLDFNMMNSQIGTAWVLSSKCKHALDICTHSWLSLHCYGSLPPLVSQWSPSFPTFCGSRTCRAWGSGGRRDVQLGLSSCADSSPTRTADAGCWWQRTNMCWNKKKDQQRVTNMSQTADEHHMLIGNEIAWRALGALRFLFLSYKEHLCKGRLETDIVSC